MNEVMIRRCLDCGTATRIEDEFCPRCGGRTESMATIGEGTVYSWTTVHRSLGQCTDTPYTVLSIDLPDQVRVLGRLCAESPLDRVAVDASVVTCPHSRDGRLEFAIESS